MLTLNSTAGSFFIKILANLSIFRVSFWDTAMSVVRRTRGRPRRPRRAFANFSLCTL